jgi:hypothetical protein
MSARKVWEQILAGGRNIKFRDFEMALVALALCIGGHREATGSIAIREPHAR